MKKANLSGEKIMSLLFAATGAAIIFISVRYGIWDRITPDKGFMPLIGGLLMCLSSIAWFLQSVRCDRQRTEENHNNFHRNEVFWMAAVPGICLIVFALLNVLGMHTTLAVFLLFWLRFVSKYSWKKTAVYAVIMSAAFYLIFSVGLAVPFPRGMLL